LAAQAGPTVAGEVGAAVAAEVDSAVAAEFHYPFAAEGDLDESSSYQSESETPGIYARTPTEIVSDSEQGESEDGAEMRWVDGDIGYSPVLTDVEYVLTDVE